MKKNTSLLVFVIVLLQNFTYAQNEDTQPINSKVENFYSTNAYSAALETYQAGNSNGQTPTQVLADSYRLTGDTHNAEHWYHILVQEEVGPPLNKLYYAQALQSNGKYKSAKKWFLNYSNSVGNSKNAGEQLAAYCDVAAVLVADEEVVVKNMEALNSAQLDFSPMFYKNGLMFTSTRNEENKMSTRTDLWTNDNFMDLYFSKVQANDLTAGLEKVFKNSFGKFHNGTATFSANQNTMYFAGSNAKKGRRKKDGEGMTRLKIYQAQYSKTGWINVNPLPFNDDKFDTCHPALSPDGNVLFFSSNRPGGFGGMDLYLAEKTGESWSEPKNLGATINTEGNEIFPFVHDDGTLYFASNGLPGIGGLDLFSTVKIENENLQSIWSIPQNLGKPINTAKDDFGLIVDVSGTKGYFSSNRKGGMGMDDIYSFSSQNTGKSIAEKAMMTTQFCVVDGQNQEAIEEVKITFSAIAADESLPFNTIQDGFLLELKPVDAQGDKYTLNLIKKNNSNALSVDNQVVSVGDGTFDASFFPNERYKIRLEKIGYKTLEMDFFYPEFLKNQSTCFAMEKLNCTRFDGQVLNQKYDRGLPNSKITVLNKCTGEVEKYTTDEDGNFAFCMSCECEYEILASKPYFSVDLKSAKNSDCASPLAMQFFLKNRSEGLDQLTAIAANHNNTNTRTNTNYPASVFPQNGSMNTGYGNGGNRNTSSSPNTYGEPASNFYNNINTKNISVGSVIELKNIFYDFDAHYIRADAEKELDNVVKLLRAFPSMQIEVGSHTDARGEQKYNQHLSQKRADAAVRYIVKEGIDGRRITGVGYGEKFLKNDCRDGFDCPEEAHQRNRRTEIKVLVLDKSELDVRYIDNAPEVIDTPSGRM